MTTTTQAPISIVAYEEDSNLNTVSWNQGFLDSVKEEYALKHCQAVLYINCAHDRFRLVVCFYGFSVLLLPPVNKEERISLYLKVSRFLKKFSKFDLATKLLDSEIEGANARIERRKRLASTAIKKSRSKR